MKKTMTDTRAGRRLFGGIMSCVSIFFAATIDAGVVGVEISDRASVLQGRDFGDAGPYEKIVGTIRFSLDPALSENRKIVDLSLAPID